MNDMAKKLSSASPGQTVRPACESLAAAAEKLLEIARLHDEAFDRAMQHDGHHKSNEGSIELVFTNRFDEERDTDPLHIKAVGVYSYVLGPSRMHYFDSVDEALETVRGWHAAEMAHVYSEDEE